MENQSIDHFQQPSPSSSNAAENQNIQPGEGSAPTLPSQTTLLAQFAALSQALNASNAPLPGPEVASPEIAPNSDVFVEHIEVPNGSMKHVVVKHLPSYYSKEMLYTLFFRFGPIAHCKLIVDKGTGESLGYAFVEYQHEEHALASVKALNGYLPQGSSRPLKVHLAAPGPASRKSLDQDKTNLFIGGLPLDMKLADLNALFARFGTILESRILPNKFIDDQGKEKAVGFVRFSDHAQALNAIETMNNAVLRDQTNQGATFKLMCKFSHDSKKQVHSAFPQSQQAPQQPMNPLLNNLNSQHQMQQQKLLQQLQLAQLQNNVGMNNLNVLSTLAAMQAPKPYSVTPSVSSRSYSSSNSSVNMPENSISRSNSSVYSQDGDLTSAFSRMGLEEKSRSGVENENYLVTPATHRFSAVDSNANAAANANLMALLGNNPLANPLAASALANPLLNPLLSVNPLLSNPLLGSMVNSGQALNPSLLSALLPKNPLLSQFSQPQ